MTTTREAEGGAKTSNAAGAVRRHSSSLLKLPFLLPAVLTVCLAFLRARVFGQSQQLTARAASARSSAHTRPSGSDRWRRRSGRGAGSGQPRRRHQLWSGAAARRRRWGGGGTARCVPSRSAVDSHVPLCHGQARACIPAPQTAATQPGVGSRHPCAGRQRRRRLCVRRGRSGVGRRHCVWSHR
jgi:hypothetical protein